LRFTAEPNYLEIKRLREEVPEKFSGFPIVSDRDGWIAERLLTRGKILEIGAGDRPFEPELRTRGFTGRFKTMDVNHSRRFDYYSVEEINEPFDAIIMREVIEHCPRPLFYSYLERFLSILTPGGLLVITTPNPWAVAWVFSDYTHISPWPPADLYGVLRWFGFQPVEICRVIWPSKFLFVKRIYWAIHSRFYDIDFAGSYIAIATKPLETANGKP
jgi:SAM-dependent methyltransferase